MLAYHYTANTYIESWLQVTKAGVKVYAFGEPKLKQQPLITIPIERIQNVRLVNFETVAN